MYPKIQNAIQEAARANRAPAPRRRTGLSRRGFLGVSAGAASLALLNPSLVLAKPLPQAMEAGGAANPVPFMLDMGDLGQYHLHLPTETLMPGTSAIDTGDGDPSTIFDFEGTVGVYEPFGGTGVRINADGTAEDMWWAGDVRFLDGKYIDVNGNEQEGTFGFF